MLNIQVDESEVRRMYLEELQKHVESLDKELVFWDTKELVKRTCMCWDTIQKEFFYDPRFPKRKVGRKWMFPAQKTKEFLLTWLDEQES